MACNVAAPRISDNLRLCQIVVLETMPHQQRFPQNKKRISRRLVLSAVSTPQDVGILLTRHE
jgi:hypothetical protein